MMTSGMTRGALTMPLKSVRPVKRRYLTRAKAARVPNTTDAQAVKNAMRRLSQRPAIISRSLASAPYHFSVKPAQRFGMVESLNE